MTHSIGSCLMDSAICCWANGRFCERAKELGRRSSRKLKDILSGVRGWGGEGVCFLTSNLRGPYLASCDLKGVGVQGDDSRMERQMFGVLKLGEMKNREAGL